MAAADELIRGFPPDPVHVAFVEAVQQEIVHLRVLHEAGEIDAPDGIDCPVCLRDILGP
jgi:hypothetical protein